MNKATLVLVTATSLTVSGLCLAQAVDQSQQSQQQSGQIQSDQSKQQSSQRDLGLSAQTASAREQMSLKDMLPQAAVKNISENKDSGIQDAVANLVNCTLDQSADLSKCTQQLISSDQQRLQQPQAQQASDQQQNQDLKQAISQLRDDYKAKYGQDLNINKDQVFGSAQFVQAEVQDPQQLASVWPLPGTAEMAVQQAGQRFSPQASGQSSQTGQTGQASDQSQTGQAGQSAQPGQSGQIGLQAGQTSGQIQLKQGEKIGACRLPAEGSAPAVTVSCVQQDGQWKVAIPQQISSSRDLSQNLAKHIKEVDQQKDQWPADQNQAQSIIAHHVLMAYYDTGTMGGTSGAQQSGFQQSGQQGQTGQQSQPGQSGQPGEQPK